MHVNGPAFPSTPNVSLGHGGRVAAVTVWTCGAVVLVELDSGAAATDFVTVLVVVLVEPHAAIEQATNTANAIVIRLIASLIPDIQSWRLRIRQAGRIADYDRRPLMRSFNCLPAHE